MLDIVLSEGAESDLESLHAFVALQRSQEEADALLQSLLDRCAALASFPLRGSVPAELADLGVEEYRQFVMGPYRVVYFVDHQKVVIALIADGRRDMRALLQRRLLNP